MRFYPIYTLRNPKCDREHRLRRHNYDNSFHAHTSDRVNFRFDRLHVEYITRKISHLLRVIVANVRTTQRAAALLHTHRERTRGGIDSSIRDGLTYE